jgi:hypothetical protein
MWSRKKQLVFDVMIGLRKGLKLVTGMRRQLSEDEQQRISGAIADHLELANWKMEKGPPSVPH